MFFLFSNIEQFCVQEGALLIGKQCLYDAQLRQPKFTIDVAPRFVFPAN
jgi:hypothetical protein